MGKGLSKFDRAQKLSVEIVDDIQKGIPSDTLIAKAAQLAMMTNNEIMVGWLKHEMTGFPIQSGNTLDPTAWFYAELGGRTYIDVNGKKVAEVLLIPDLEKQISTLEKQLEAAKDVSVQISSANPYQHVFPPLGNSIERNTIVQQITAKQKIVSKVIGSVKLFILNTHQQLQWGTAVENLFEIKRKNVDNNLSKICPAASNRLPSLFENIKSKRPEDWANAVTACRRMLTDLADSLFPASDQEIVAEDGKTYKLDAAHDKMRLKQYIKINQGPAMQKKLTQSQLESVSSLIDALHGVESKGTHKNVSKEEAEQVVIQTYLLFDEILNISMNNEITAEPTESVTPKERG